MNLESVYKKEIEQFEHALQISEKILDTAATSTIDQISEQVGERENIIAEIKSLEADKKKQLIDTKNNRFDQYKNTISGLAEKLVEIDNQIFKRLQDKKIKLVQKYSRSSDSSYSRNKVFEQEKTSKIVDIRQK